MQFIQIKRQDRLQGFTAAFPLILPISAHTIQQIRKPPIHRLRHAGGHTVKCSTSQIPPPRRTLYRSAQPPIIIRYIRVQHTANRASPAGSAPIMCGLLASADTLPAVQTRRACWWGGVNVSTCTGSVRRRSRCFPRQAKALAPVSLALAWHTSGIVLSSWRGGAEPLTATAVSLFGLSPDNQ